MKHLRAALLIPLPVVGTVVAGLAVAWVGRFGYVLGMAVIVLGLAAGALTAVASLASRGRVDRAAKALALVAVVAGWLGVQWMDDVQFRSAFREDFAAARFADSGAPADDAFTEDDVALFGETAPWELSQQVVKRVGSGGIWGRWLFRADAGVRLFGSWNNGRGLAVGRWGAIAWAAAQIFLAVWLAWLVLARTWRRHSADVPSDLDD